MVKTVTYNMGKRQVKNESALKEIRIPEEGEMFGRVLKMLGGENVMIKCTDGLTRRGRIRGKKFGKIGVWIPPEEKEKIENLVKTKGLDILILPRMGISKERDSE